MEEKNCMFSLVKCSICGKVPFVGLNYSKFLPEIEEVCENGHFLRINLFNFNFDEKNETFINNEKLDLKIYLNKEEKDKIKNNIKLCEKKIEKIKSIYDKIKNLLLKQIDVIDKKFKKYYIENKLEISFIKYFYELYEINERKNSLSKNFINNIKNILNFNIDLLKFESYENIYQRADKFSNYISYTDNYILRDSNLNEKYKEIYIMNNNIINNNSITKDISKYNQLKEIKTNDEIVLHLIQLKINNYIAVALMNNLIYIYDINFSLKYIINNHPISGIIYDMIELKNGKLITCLNDKYIRIFTIKNDNYEIYQLIDSKYNLNKKIIECSNEKIISCSVNNTVIIFGKNNQYYYVETIIKVMATSICEVNNKEFLTYSLYNDSIIFFDKISYQKISTINSLLCSNHMHSMVVLNNFLFISGKGIYIINIKDHQLIERIDSNKNRPMQPSSPLILLNNSHILSCRTDNYDIYLKEWKLENNNILLLSEKYIGPYDTINSIIQLKNGNILFSSDSFKGMRLLG